MSARKAPIETKEGGDKLAARRLPADLRKLRRRIAKVTDILSRCSFSEAELQRGQGYWRFMVLCFATKQLEHGRSVLSLRHTSDSSLIARSMLEGVALLGEAQSNPESEARRWFDFDAVMAFREAKTRRHLEQIGAARDLPINGRTIGDLEAEAKRDLVRVGGQFLSPESRKRKEKGLPSLADPYAKTWHARSITEILRRDAPRAFLVWSAMSESHHFRPRHFARALRRSGDAIKIDVRSIGSRATGVGIAVHCLDAILRFLREIESH